MGVPIFYQGSKYKPVPFVPIPLDPIDSLRGSAVGYWPMDELSGNRADATGHGLTLSKDSAPDIPGVPGKIGNASQFTDNLSDASALQSLTLDSANFGAGIGLSFWLKFNQFVPGDDGQFYIARIHNGIDIPAIALHIGIKTIGQPEMTIYDTVQSSALSINTWHFVAYWKDGAGVYLQIDNQDIVSHAPVLYANPSLIDLIGQPSFVNEVDTFLVDEMLLINKSFSSGERDYLWNNGAGRALFS